MNKREMVTKIAERTGQTQKNVDLIIRCFCELVGTTLNSGDTIRLTGFGTFETKTRAARVGKNPQTGEDMVVPATTLPVFKAGKDLKDKVKTN